MAWALNLMKKPVFDAEKEIPDLSGKVLLITGGTGGLGKESVLSFAAHNPAHIYFTGRSQPSADKVAEEAKAKYPNTPVTFLKCDLASHDAVRDAAKHFLSKESRLDILSCNAGIMAVPAGLTKDGYEIQFGTNHVGHALLVKLLTPLLEATAQKGHDVRIVWDTSLGHRGHPTGGILFDKLKTPQTDIFPIMGEWMRYGQSKLANLLYARAYAKHHPSITSVSVHPGVSATGLVGGLTFWQKALVYTTSWSFMIPPEQCAWNQQWAATAPLGDGPRQVVNGTYYEPVGLRGSLVPAAADDELAAKLWEWTERELEGYKV
ncbi:hypothetical protein M409DRAFT_24304 [Zasmidium cellare ATCC 36951]|uniref:Oxidoreductase n=1 Tax=Zasmidium cellare ATCC 36951 TaxID=1080233 RepID=A0A6A6CEC7_ZASCE|nr:uncharacterized protein M409DRAFT_24304 [Zasmidium cellare ATCC 36951]KAF2165455.1 hypothetical protein M409DRAFT_24304 [Zasmidium cellare ATCC 36951]